MPKKETHPPALRTFPYYEGELRALLLRLMRAAHARQALCVFTPGATVAAAAERDGALYACTMLSY